MKKMLKRLFLFLFLTLTTINNIKSGETPYYNKVKLTNTIERIERNNKLLANLSSNIEKELTDIADLVLDSIPIQSPISVHEITKISSDYGVRTHPIYNIRRFHNGIDFVAPQGSNILSTADGIVINIKNSNHGYGNQIVIEHGNGYETRYAHLSEIQVTIGQKVRVGQIIGTLGNSGLTTGPHLHYEIINNKNQIDPMFFTYNNKSERNKDQYISTLNALETT